jgi:hypothetical protein
MGSKYSRYQPDRGVPREIRNRIHPIWRGVGLAMIVIFPIIGFAGANVLIELNGKNNWMPLPPDLFAGPGDFIYSFWPDQLAYIKLIIMACIIAILAAIFTFISFLISGTFGVTNKQDPFYVPPVRRKSRRRF